MKTQKIDLYNKLYSVNPNEKTLNWRKFIILNALFIIFLVILAASQYFQNYLLGFHEKKMSSKLELLENTFLTKKKQYPEVFFKHDAETFITNKSQELRVQKRLLTNISNHSSLSNFLNEFSKIITPNSWLTDIQIHNGGNLINLHGKALNYSAIKVFLSKINNSLQLKKYQLNIENIEENPETPSDPVEFKVILQKWPT